MSNGTEPIIPKYELVPFMKEEFPDSSFVKGQSDYDIYEAAKAYYHSKDSSLVFDENPYIKFDTDKWIDKTANEKTADYTPDAFNYAEAALRGDAPDLGLSEEALMHTYNNSFAGAAYAFEHGEFKYPLTDYEPEGMEEIASFVAGTLNPTDAIMFAGSASVGNLIWRKTGGKVLKWGMTKYLANSANNKLVQQGVAGRARDKIIKNVVEPIVDKNTEHLASKVFDATISHQGGLGGYMAAVQTSEEAKKQAIEINNPELAKQLYGENYNERTEFNYWDISTKGAGGFGEGLATGLVTGPSGVLTGKLFDTVLGSPAKAKSAWARQGLTLAKGVAELGVEGTAFTGTGYLFHGGPDGFMDAMGDVGVSTSILGILRLPKATRALSDGIKDINNAAKNAAKQSKKKTPIEESIDNVVEDLKTQRTNEGDNKKSNAEILLEDNIGQKNKAALENTENLSDLQKIVVGANKLIKKGDLEGADRIVAESSGYTSFQGLRGFYDRLIKDEAYRKELGLNDPLELEANKIIWENRLNNVDKVLDIPNEKQGTLNYSKKIIEDIEAGKVRETFSFTEEVIKEKSKELGMDLAQYDLSRIADRKAATLDIEAREGRLTERAVLLEKAKSGQLAYEEASQLRKAELLEVLEAQGLAKALGTEMTPVEYANKKANWEIITNKGPTKVTDIKLTENQLIIRKYFNNPDNTKRLKNVPENLQIIATDFALKNIGKSITKEQIADFKNKNISDGTWDGFTKQEIAEAVEVFKQGKTKWEGTTSKYTKEAIVFTEYLSKLGKDFSTMEVSDLDRFIFERKHLSTINHSATTGLNLLMQHLHKHAYIKELKLEDFKDKLKQTKAAQNELTAAGKKDSGPGTRKVGIEVGKELGKQGDLQSELASILGAKYLVRLSEVPKLRLHHLKKHGKEWYIDGLKDFVKPGTSERYVWLESKFAQRLKNYLENNKQITTKALSQALKEHPFFAKNKGDRSAGKEPFYSFRRRGSVVGELTLNSKQYRSFKYLKGHDMSRLERVYQRGRKIGEVIPMQKAIHKAAGIGKNIGTSASYQLESLREPFTSKQAMERFLQRRMRTDKSLKVAIESDKDYAGKFHKGIIYLTEGKSNPHTFFHEMGHKLQDFVKLTKNKELINLIERGKKMFSKEAQSKGYSRAELRNMEASELIKIAQDWKMYKKINLPKYKNAKRGSSKSKELVDLMLEHQKNEFFMDRMADYGAGMSSTVRSKISSWGKLMLSKLKKVFFGKENLNKHDIARLLGEKVYKGVQTDNSIFVGERAKYKIKNAKGFTSDLRNKVRELIADIQKISVKEAKKIESDFIQTIAEQAGIENPHNFRITTKYAKNVDGASNLIKFYEQLTGPEARKLQKKNDLVKWMRKFDKVDELRKDVGITEKKQSQLLRDFLDIEDIRKTSVEELKQYESLIGHLKYKPIVEKTWAQEVETFSEMHPELVNKRSFSDGLAIGTLGPVTMLKKLGGPYDKIAKKLHSHNSSFLAHVGTFDVLQHHSMARLAGFPKTADASLVAIGKGRRMFENIKDFIPLTMKKQRYYEHRKEGTLKKGHEEFFNKVYHKNGKMKDTPEAQVVKIHQEFNKYLREQFELIAQLKITNPAKYEQFLKKNGIEWQDPKSYVPDIFTQDFKDAYPVESIKSSRLLDKLVKEIAVEEAIKENPKLSKTEIQKKLPDYMEYAQYEAERRFYDQRNYGDAKSVSKFFLPKEVNFPEFWDSSKAGKRIQVHESTYDATFERMAYSQGLYLANFEWFPEHIKLKGYKHSGPDAKTIVQNLRRTNPKWGEYIDRSIKHRLGIGESKFGTVWDSMGRNLVKPASSLLAKQLLMFPVHGLKNFLVGEYMSMHLFGPYRTIYAQLKAINHQNRIDLINAGVRTVGIKHLTAPTGLFRDVHKSNAFARPIKKFSNKLNLGKLQEEMFHYISQMKQSESLNRYTAGMASKMEGHFLADVLQNYPSNHKKYKRAINKLNDTYELTSGEIEIFKKYGMGGIEGHGLTGFEAIKEARNIHNIHQKMITQGHIKSQGSSQEMFFPEWTSAKGAKEGTLFLRMAYKGNVNAYYNTKAAWRSRNKIEATVLTSMQILGPLVTGEILLQLGSRLFGKTMPQENDNWYDKFYVTFLAGEGASLAGSFFNRMNDGLLNVVLVGTARRIMALAEGLANDTMTGEQGVDEFLKTTSSLYRHSKAMYMQAKHPDVLKRKKFDSWYRDFDKKVYTEKPDNDRYNGNITSRSSKFYKELRKDFEMGSTEDFIREWQLTALAEVAKHIRPGQKNFAEGLNTLKGAIDKAEQSMANYAYALNPNPANYDRQKWKKGKAPVQSKLNEWFLNYLSGDGPIRERKWVPVYKTRDGKGTTTDISKAQRFKNGQPILDWSKNPPKIKELWELEVKYHDKFEKLFYEGHKGRKDGMLKDEFRRGKVWWYTDKDGLERFVFEKNKDKIPKDAKNIRKAEAFDLMKAIRDIEPEWDNLELFGKELRDD